MLNDYYRLAFRKKIYEAVDALQTDLDAWLDQYNDEREHQGRWCYGKTPMRRFPDSRERCQGEAHPSLIGYRPLPARSTVSSSLG
jgi:hypothetical protein